MAARERFIGVYLLLATSIWSLAIALLGSTDALLYLAPALLIAIPLALGRYVGEEALAEARTRTARRPLRAPLRVVVRGALNPGFEPRGSMLFGWSLAKRPPPVVPVAI